MDSSNKLCANCKQEFPKKSKGYRRHSVYGQLPGRNVTPGEILGINFTPQSKHNWNFFCPDCFKLIVAYADLKDTENQFNKCTQADSYIATKRARPITPSKTPRKTKVFRSSVELVSFMGKLGG